jgi:hypothetical protein
MTQAMPHSGAIAQDADIARYLAIRASHPAYPRASRIPRRGPRDPSVLRRFATRVPLTSQPGTGAPPPSTRSHNHDMQMATAFTGKIFVQ